MATWNTTKWKWIGLVICVHSLAASCNAFICVRECNCTPLSETALPAGLQRNRVYGKCVCGEHNFLPREYTDAYALVVEYIDHAVLGDDCGQTFPHLIYLNMSGFQYILPGTFRGHGQVKYLHLLREFMHVIEQNVFLGLDCLEQLWADNCGIYALKDGAFLGMPKLHTMSLSNNSIWSIHQDSFLGLTNLVHLDLSCNKISELQQGHFRHLSKLKKLILAMNSIKQVERKAFEGLTDLEFIDLRNNLLKILPQPGFFMGEAHPHNSFMTVYLHGNSLRCYCQLSWVYKYINDDRFIIEGICSAPEEVAGQTLDQVYGAAMDQCKPNGTDTEVPSGTKIELPCTITDAAWLLPDGTKITERGQCWDDFFLSNNNYLVIWNTKHQHTGTYVCQTTDGEDELYYNVVVDSKPFRLSGGMWVILLSCCVAVFILALILTAIYRRCRRHKYKDIPGEAPHQHFSENNIFVNVFSRTNDTENKWPGGSDAAPPPVRSDDGNFPGESKYNDRVLLIQ